MNFLFLKVLTQLSHLEPKSLGPRCFRRISSYREKKKRVNQGVRITILGANGQIGQVAALLLKQSPLVAKLNLHDLTSTRTVATDLQYICTACEVVSYHGPLQLLDALKDAEIVLLMSGRSWKPGMTQQDLFALNAGVVRTNATACAVVCPHAIIGVMAPPINSNVPLVCEVLKKEKKYNPDRIIGMVTLDEITANCVVADSHTLDPSFVHVPIIGGASERTTIPLLSHARPFNSFTEGSMVELICEIRDAQMKVVMSKGGVGKPMLSTGYASARFALTLARAVLGDTKVVMSAYVRSNCLAHIPYLATPLRFGASGVAANLGIPRLNAVELALFEHTLPEIEQDIVRGVSYSRQVMAPSVLNV